VRTRRQRNSDLKIIAAATVAVLLAGGLIAAGLLIVTSDSTKTRCGRVPLGPAETIRAEIETEPAYQTGGGNCGFWLALDSGDIVAYKVEQPGGCALQPEGGEFRCGSETPDRADLATYPVSIEEIDGIDTVVVDLNPPGVPTSTD
jgi:hypothetical protein